VVAADSVVNVLAAEIAGEGAASALAQGNAILEKGRPFWAGKTVSHDDFMP